MTNSESPDDGITRTTVEINTEVWRTLRGRGVEDGKQVSEMLEEVLRDYFDMEHEKEDA